MCVCVCVCCVSALSWPNCLTYDLESAHRQTHKLTHGFDSMTSTADAGGKKRLAQCNNGSFIPLHTDKDKDKDIGLVMVRFFGLVFHEGQWSNISNRKVQTDGRKLPSALSPCYAVDNATFYTQVVFISCKIIITRKDCAVHCKSVTSLAEV